MKSNELCIYLLGRIEIIDHMVNSTAQVTPKYHFLLIYGDFVFRHMKMIYKS